MHIVITGSLGHTGKPLTERLVNQGHTVTVISTKADKHKDIEALGAKAAIGSVDDVDFLVTTFTGADAVYAMIPPNFSTSDSRAYYRNIGNKYAQAIRRTGVKTVVHFSSWGADLDKGTGFILGSHDVEGVLNELTGVAVTHLRAGFLFYNLNHFIGMIKSAGFIGTNYGGDDLIMMTAPVDVADAAAEALTTPSTGITIRYVASDDRTPNDAARVLGAAIGKPDLTWVLFTDEQVKQTMLQNGVPESTVDSIVELNAAIHSGIMRKGYEATKPQKMGKVKLEDFAKEFAATFGKS